jgi:hypothetical protein
MPDIDEGDCAVMDLVTCITSPFSSHVYLYVDGPWSRGGITVSMPQSVVVLLGVEGAWGDQTRLNEGELCLRNPFHGNRGKISKIT